MTREIVERLVQEVAEGHDDKNEAKSDKSIARPQTQYHQSPGKKFNEGDRYTDKPERPDGQKGIGERQEIFAGMLERPQLKDLPEARHEKDQSEDEPRKEQRPGASNIMLFSLQGATKPRQMLSFVSE